MVGDAATQVKATAGGGIVQGMIAAKVLSKALMENKNYELMWRKSIGLGLYVHLLARKIMDKFNYKDWSYFFDLFKSPKLRAVLQKEDRDNLKLFFKIALSKPRTLYLLKFLL